MTAADRMRRMRDRRQTRGLREIRLVVPDPRSPAVRRRIAKQFASFNSKSEEDAMQWIESVSEFDNETR